MRKQTTEEKEVNEKQTVVIGKSATCNKCGKIYTANLNSENPLDYEDGLWDAEIHSFGVSFGYGSSHDTERWGFDLCDDCLVEIIKTFKYVPDGFFEDPSYFVIQDRKEHQKVFDNWKTTGKWEELKYKTYDELVNDFSIYRTNHLNEVIKKYHPGKPLLKYTHDENWIKDMENLLGINKTDDTHE